MKYPFKSAKYFQKASRSEIDLIVIHDMEWAERVDTAENCAAFFQDPKGPGGKPAVASAHYCVDSDSIVQCVEEKDVAWHAGPVNGYSIGIEHAGYAAQTAAQWADEYSTKMLERSAELVGELCRRYGIPVVRLSGEDLKAGKRRGICGHFDVTIGLQGGRGHWDPGPEFPWAKYLEMVRRHVEWGAEPPTEPSPVKFRDPDVVRPDQIAGPPDFSLFVEVVLNGVTWLVSPIYIAPVGIGQAKKLATALGCELPTPALVDAIWRAADLRVNPAYMFQVHDGTAGGMNSEALLARVAEALRVQVGERSLGTDFRLLAGAFKDVAERDGKLGLYGWHVNDSSEYLRVGKQRGIVVPTYAPSTPSAPIVQQFYTGHLASWVDYSQGVRLCRKK